EPGISRPELGVDCDCLLKEFSRLCQVFACATIKMEHAALVNAPGIKTVSRLHSCTFAFRAAQLRFNRADKRLCNLILHSKDIRKRAIVASGPYVIPAGALDQARADANAVISTTHAPYKQVADAELTGDLLQVNFSILVGKGRMTRDHEKPPH